MTTKEKIAVMQAFLDGKPIEYKLSSDDDIWLSNYDPHWDWDNCIYRIKPGSKFRPYRNPEEFLQAQKEHGNALYNKVNDEYYTPTQISKGGINVMYENNTIYHTFDKLLHSEYNYVWQDGTPCGITEE